MLYHINKGIPFNMNLPDMLRLTYSKHAMNEALHDEYGVIDLEYNLDTKEAGAKILEVQTDDVTGNPIKIMIRTKYTDRYDLFTVISLENPKCGRFLVKTVWLAPVVQRARHINLENYSRVA